MERSQLVSLQGGNRKQDVYDLVDDSSSTDDNDKVSEERDHVSNTTATTTTATTITRVRSADTENGSEFFYQKQTKATSENGPTSNHCNMDRNNVNRSESDVDEDDWLIMANNRKRQRPMEEVLSDCTIFVSESQSLLPSATATTGRVNTNPDEQQHVIPSPIYLFATSSDLCERNRAKDNKSHWSYSQCRALREMIGFEESDYHQRTIEWIVIVNYIINFDVLLDELPELVSVPRVVVFYGSNDGTSTDSWKNLVNDTSTIDFVQLRPSDRPRSINNPLDVSIPYGVHHTKCFLIGYTNQTIRICIHTSNIRSSDIYSKAQGAYIQDFHIKEHSHQEKQHTTHHAPITLTTMTDTKTTVSSLNINATRDQEQESGQQPHCEFEETLISYFSTYKYDKKISWSPGRQPETLVQCLRRYDYSTAQIILIPSTPGYHPMALVKGTKSTTGNQQKMVTARNPYSKKHRIDATIIGHTTSSSVSMGSIASTERRCMLRGHIKLRQAILDSTNPPVSNSTMTHQSLSSNKSDDKVQQKKRNSTRVQNRIVCQFSSIGSLTEKYLKELQRSMDIYSVHNPSNSKPTYPRIMSDMYTNMSSQLVLVYPTVENIRTSVEGYYGGGSVPGTAKNVQKSFLLPFYHKWSVPTQSTSYDKKSSNDHIETISSVRISNHNSNPLWKGQNVPHIKTYYQTISNDCNRKDDYDNNHDMIDTSANNDCDSNNCFEWFVLTSHNMSKAAWGESIRSNRWMGSTTGTGTGNPAGTNIDHHGRHCLFIRHWELGVYLSPTLLGVDKLIPYHPSSESSSRPTCRHPCKSTNPIGRNGTGLGCSGGDDLLVQHGATKISASSNSTISISTIPLPYPIHPVRYNPRVNDVPWAVDYSSFNQPDRFGRYGI